MEFCKAVQSCKGCKNGVSQVINLVNIANNQLPSVQHRFEQLQKQNNLLDSIVATKHREIQILDGQIIDRREELDAIKSEICKRGRTITRFTTAKSKSRGICV
jgi:hypothetical protein